jgi:hypothetical protein
MNMLESLQQSLSDYQNELETLVNLSVKAQIHLDAATTEYDEVVQASERLLDFGDLLAGRNAKEFNLMKYTSKAKLVAAVRQVESIESFKVKVLHNIRITEINIQKLVSLH